MNERLWVVNGWQLGRIRGAVFSKELKNFYLPLLARLSPPLKVTSTSHKLALNVKHILPGQHPKIIKNCENMHMSKMCEGSIWSVATKVLSAVSLFAETCLGYPKKIVGEILFALTYKFFQVKILVLLDFFCYALLAIAHSWKLFRVIVLGAFVS